MKKQTNKDNCDVAIGLAKLQSDYIEKLPAKLNLINDVWRKLTHLSWHDEAFAIMYRLIHSLSGSGTTFGCKHVSVAAKALERYLHPLIDNNRAPTEKERAHIISLMENITSAVNRDSATHKPVLLPDPVNYPLDNCSDRTIFVVDDDHYICTYLSELLSNIGYRVLVFANPSIAIKQMSQCIPDAVIMDIMFPVGDISGIDAANDIRALSGKRVPMIYISARSDLVARAQVVRAGGDAYFTKPLNFPQLAKCLENLLENTEAYKILIIDDDVELSEHNSLLLENANMKTQVVNQPVNTITHLEEFQPDLILMDLHMPAYSGLELASIIRQDENFIGLPIVFLSSESNTDYHDQAIGLGANEFLCKPIAEQCLVGTINKQVRLAREIRGKIKKISKIDPNTGLYNRNYFLEKLDVTLTLAKNSIASKSLFCIQIDNIELLTDRFGVQFLDSINQQCCSLINKQLSISDLISQFCDGQYMVLASERDPRQIEIFAKSLTDSVRNSPIRVDNQKISISCSIGISIINEYVRTLKELITNSEEMCRQSQDKGADSFIINEILPDNKKRKKELLARVNYALEKKSFQLVYQPIISVDNRGYENYEALLRMIDCEGRTILPSQFLPILEQNNDMVGIDKWVIQHAIHQIASDTHAKMSTDIFIKVSGKTLSDKLLVPLISNSMTEGGIAGEARIIFHIHEKDMATYIDETILFSKNLKKLGCGICIDHFGSTNNSVTVSERVKPTFVKFRNTALQDILVNRDVRERIQNLVKKAKERDITVIASSIEDPATLSTLWEMGVRYFQGYFIQAPENALNFNFSSNNSCSGDADQ